MPTFNQLIKNKRKKKKKINRTPALDKCPQKKGLCIKIVTRAPKKPNSAKRKIVKLRLLSNNKRVYAYIPGEGAHYLQPYSTVAIRGGRTPDLPGLKYRLVRGTFDLMGVDNRKTSRSKYGVKKSLNKYF